MLAAQLNRTASDIEQRTKSLLKNKAFKDGESSKLLHTSNMNYLMKIHWK